MPRRMPISPGAATGSWGLSVSAIGRLGGTGGGGSVSGTMDVYDACADQTMEGGFDLVR